MNISMNCQFSVSLFISFYYDITLIILSKYFCFEWKTIKNWKADMPLVYGWSNGMVPMIVCWMLYPGRRVSHHTIFAAFNNVLREICTFNKQTAECGRPRIVRIVQLEEAAFALITKSPERSTRINCQLIECIVLKIRKNSNFIRFIFKVYKLYFLETFCLTFLLCFFKSLKFLFFLNGVLFLDEVNFWW